MIRDRYPWPRRPFFSSYRASFSVSASSFPSLVLWFSFYVPRESFRATTNMPLDARALWRTGRGRKRGRAVGLVSIMGWNMKRMQTWNNTTLDRVFRCGILPLSFLSHRFSPHIAVPVISYAYPLALIIFAAGPVPKGGTWNLRQCWKSPYISGAFCGLV